MTFVPNSIPSVREASMLAPLAPGGQLRSNADGGRDGSETPEVAKPRSSGDQNLQQRFYPEEGQ